MTERVPQNRAQALPRRPILALLAALTLLSEMGCTLLVDADAASVGCSVGTKDCEGHCVPSDSPEWGCQSESCSPCAPKNAVARCDGGGACVVAACIGTWVNCDDDSKNGCEVNINDDQLHCGGCSRPCSEPTGGESACGSSQCYVRRCDPGLDDCNWKFSDGCETNLTTDADHCGTCETSCGDAACRASACEP